MLMMCLLIEMTDSLKWDPGDNLWRWFSYLILYCSKKQWHTRYDVDDVTPIIICLPRLIQQYNRGAWPSVNLISLYQYNLSCHCCLRYLNNYKTWHIYALCTTFSNKTFISINNKKFFIHTRSVRIYIHIFWI